MTDYKTALPTTDYQAAVDAVVRKTYQEHALGSRPWGTGKYGCSYEAGCAIGISVSHELAFEMDNAPVNYLHCLLEDDEDLQLALFSVVGKPPETVISQLVKLQTLHDTHATTPLFRETPFGARDAYKSAIEYNFPKYRLNRRVKRRQYEDLRAGQRYCERLPRPWPRQGATCGKGLQAESGRGSVKPLIEIISDNTVQGEQTWPIPASISNFS